MSFEQMWQVLGNRISIKAEKRSLCMDAMVSPPAYNVKRIDTMAAY